MLFHGIAEKDQEDCDEPVGDLITDKIGLDYSDIQVCGVHRLGKKVRGRSRPIIVRFTCRADRDEIWKRKRRLRNTNIFISEDLPKAVREIRKRILIPAKATVIGDKLVVDERVYLESQIPERWLSNHDSSHGE